MSKNTTTPIRVTAAEIAATIAAYPAGPTGGWNIFGGRAGASRATVIDFCFCACPKRVWYTQDILQVHVGLQKRGLKPRGRGADYALTNAVGPSGIINPKFTCFNGQHLQEQHDMSHPNANPWKDNKGAGHPRVVLVDGGYLLNPEWLKHLQGQTALGYPNLPLKPGASGKASAGKASAGKASAGKPAAGKAGASGKGSGKPVAPAAAPALTAPPVTEVIRVTPADTIK